MDTLSALRADRKALHSLSDTHPPFRPPSVCDKSDILSSQEKKIPENVTIFPANNRFSRHINWVLLLCELKLQVSLSACLDSQATCPQIHKER